jgi:Zn-dependent protease/CBS domain-containing protein
MRWSLRVARVGGTEIRVHLTFLLLLVVIAVATGASAGVAEAFGAVVFILLLFASVVLHELGHATAARHLGIRTPDITLLPIGGVARLERIPREPRQELAVALAGPAVTLAIAVAAFLLLRVVPRGAPAGEMIGHLLTANVVLLGFNLLPAFPMDGGRVLRALLATRMDYLRATRAASSVGQAFAVLFGVVGLFVFPNPLLLLVAVFVFLGARQEALAAAVQEAIVDRPVSAAMVTDFRMLSRDATLADAAKLLLETLQQDYPVVDDAGRPCGLLTRARLLRALGTLGPGAAVSSAMAVERRTLSGADDLAEAFRRMQEGSTPLLPVVNGEGRLVGLLTPETLAEMVMIRDALVRADALRVDGRSPAPDAGPRA